LWTLGPFHRSTKHELEPLLDKKGKRNPAPRSLLAGTFKQRFIKTDGGSHMPKHTHGMSVCQKLLKIGKAPRGGERRMIRVDRV
jgi:hypothetical protein